MGERQGVRERLGVALYRLAEVHRRRGLRASAGSAWVAVREEMEGSGVFVRVVQGAREREEERDELRVEPRNRMRIGGLGRLWARAAWAGQRGEGGGQRGGVLQTSRHLDWRKGEARGGRGRGVNARVLCHALQSMQMAGIRGFLRAPALPLVSCSCKGE